MYEDLIKRLRGHQCDAGEDDTQDFCEECQYDVIIEDNSTFSGVRKVCLCGLMKKAADAIEAQDRHILTLQREMTAEAESHISLVERLNKQIEALSKMEKTTRWIPVTERLPSENGFYLCLYNHNHPGGIAMDEGLSILQWFCGRWNLNEIYTVTHWMPIPEPPKEEC